MKIAIDRISGSVIGTVEGQTTNGQDWVYADPPEWYTGIEQLADMVYADGELRIDPAAALARAKTEAVAGIKATVAAQIAATAWRMERAAERDAIGAAGETPQDVMREREAIRRAGNRAETEVAALADIEAVRAHTWAVEPGDWPPVIVATQLEFMRRMTAAERQAARNLAATDPNIADAAHLLDAARDVRVTDPDTAQYLAYLEHVGVLAEGRAAEILGA